MTLKWNPAQYDKFNAAREAPLHDLLALIERRPAMRVVDLGCGPGNITAKLAAALPDSDVLGINSSEEMLTTAAEHAGPRLRFEVGGIEEFADGNGQPYDLIFSNAALQWVPEHATLLP